jgi:muconolactone D-isomerase
MDIDIPTDLDPAERTATLARELEYARNLQRAGKWPHIWRVAGEYSNISVFDVESNDELHAALSRSPLFPFMNIRMTPLATHPSDVARCAERVTVGRDGTQQQSLAGFARRYCRQQLIFDAPVVAHTRVCRRKRGPKTSQRERRP